MANRRKTVDVASTQFYKFDKWLLMEDGLKKLSPTAKMLYMVLKDREELSLKNEKYFTDDEGNLFQYYDQEKASDLLGISLTAVKKAFKDLIEYKLIESVRQGQGKPNRLYILDYEITESTLKELSYENKKASNGGTKEAETKSNKNNCTNSISNNSKKNTSKIKENKLNPKIHRNLPTDFLNFTEEELEEHLHIQQREKESNTNKEFKPMFDEFGNRLR